MAKNVEAVVINLKKFDRTRIDRVAKAVRMTMDVVARYAKKTHPYDDKSQNLTKSISSGKLEVNTNDITGLVTANTEYAEYVERRWNGRFAYLGPALKANESYFHKLVKKALR